MSFSGAEENLCDGLVKLAPISHTRTLPLREYFVTTGTCDGKMSCSLASLPFL